ncbi:hypothetical protein E2C01_062774 [Portunus trituberculatus]|uniref:Uncharacterized protein n=1 Tax=Portunus trituberculatus TaxID=210409 RepID=A0A5B7HC11_PORTR|nr:hypothetical protein [Portunus trituberculatus]
MAEQFPPVSDNHLHSLLTQAASSRVSGQKKETLRSSILIISRGTSFTLCVHDEGVSVIDV